VLRRDSYLCQLQLPGCTTRANTVHISPLLRGNHDPGHARHLYQRVPSLSWAHRRQAWSR